MKPIRWWPAAVLIVLFVFGIAYYWLSDQDQRQDRMVGTIIVTALTFIGLVLWLLLLSRMAWKLRLGILGGLVLLIFLFRSLVTVKGVTGDWIPELEWRFAAAPDLSAPATTTAGAANLASAPSNDFPQFLGPDRDGTLPGPKLARDWDARPPELVWRKPVGPAWSSFAVAGDLAVTQEQRGELEMVVAYELKSGRELWATGAEARFDTTLGGVGPRATPTLVDGRVYTLGAFGLLSCLDADTGELVWSRNVVEENDSPLPEWGKSGSPLVLGDLVVVTAGGPGKALVAYDRDTGEPRWQAGDDRSSYSSPLFTELAGREQIVSFNATSATGHDPADGTVLWSHPWPSGGAAVVAQPLRLGDDRLLLSSGYGVGAGLIEIGPGTGTTQAATPLWSNLRLKAKFSQMVAFGDHVYGLDDGILVCLDPATGERCWKRGRFGHGQILLVGDLLLLQTEDGELLLIEPNPDELRERGRIEAVSGKAWNTMALAGSLLLMRTEEEAACFALPLDEGAGGPPSVETG